MIRNPNLHVRRFEFKYLVSERKLDDIRRALKNFVISDPYALSSKNGVYIVNSLYFDDLNLSSYFEKLAGLKARKKFRIRTYENSLNKNSQVYLEIKRRDEVVIFKDRSLVPFKSVLMGLEDGSYEKLIGHGEKDVTNQFVSYFIKNSLKPNVLISYCREAYLDSKNYSFRITIDQDLSAVRSHDISFDRSGLFKILPGYVILEAKFNRIMPAWFGPVIRSFNLDRTSFSKYCFGLESCAIVPRTDLSNLSNIWI